jgi:peptide/nickel transport system substrate-binding protein
MEVPMFARHIRWVFAVLLVLSAVLTGCGSSGGTANEVSIRLIWDFDTLDPHKTLQEGAMQIGLATYDRLLAFDKDGKIIPGIVEKYDITPNSFTGTLKPGIKCSDGTALTASMVAASLTRMGAKETAAPYAYRVIGKTGFTATGDDASRVVSIKLNAPNTDMGTGLAMPYSNIICPKGLADPELLKSQTFGTGAFTLDSSLRGDSYTLKARSDWKWGPEGITTSAEGFPQKITFKVVANDTTSVNMLLNKQIDIAFAQGREVDRAAADKTLFHITAKPAGVNAVSWNETAGRPGADIAVRQAIELIIDPAAWNQAQTFGHGILFNTMLTEEMQCYSKDNGKYNVPTDPAKAEQVLTAAGYKKGADGKWSKDGAPLKIHIAGYSDQGAGNEYLLETLTKFGVTATMEAPDMKTWEEVLWGTGEWDLGIQPYWSLMRAPSIYIGQMSGTPPPDGNNFTHMANADFEKYANLGWTGQGDVCQNWLLAEQALFKNFDAKALNVDTFDWFARGWTFRPFTIIVDPLTIRKAK